MSLYSWTGVPWIQSLRSGSGFNLFLMSVFVDCAQSQIEALKARRLWHHPWPQIRLRSQETPGMDNVRYVVYAYICMFDKQRRRNGIYRDEILGSASACYSHIYSQPQKDHTGKALIGLITGSNRPISEGRMMRWWDWERVCGATPCGVTLRGSDSRHWGRWVVALVLNLPSPSLPLTSPLTFRQWPHQQPADTAPDDMSGPGLADVSISFTSMVVYAVSGLIFLLLIFLLVLMGVSNCDCQCSRWAGENVHII